MLSAVSALASLQARPTLAVENQVTRLLQYCARFPANSLVLRASTMQLCVQSDASFNSRPKGRSVAGAIFYLVNQDNPGDANGAIFAFSKLIDVVVASAGEAEYAGVFLASCEAVNLRNMLSSLGYPQTSTTILCDNKFAIGLAHDTLTAKRSKSIDVKFHWIRDRVRQGQFNLIWREGANNLADFFTKPLPVHRHLELIPQLVQVSQQPHTYTKPQLIRKLSYLNMKTSPVPTN